MAKYNEQFNLNPREIDIIEAAVREQIFALSSALLPDGLNRAREIDERIREYHKLLGKLHNSKIWYGQVNPTGVPLG